MMLTPMMPPVMLLALAISSCKSRLLMPFVRPLALPSSRSRPTAAITPIPPQLATAAASPARDIPTPMPPWTMGTLAILSPMRNEGMISLYIVISCDTF